MEIVVKPIKITKANFAAFGDVISSNNVKPMDINAGYAKRFDNLANIDVLKDKGKAIVSIFSALKHPLGSQAFIPIKETTFLSFVAPSGKVPEINKIQSFIIPPKIGINYKPDIWHFPLISTEDTNFLVIDRKGIGENLIIHKFDKEKIVLEYYGKPAV